MPGAKVRGRGRGGMGRAGRRRAGAGGGRTGEKRAGRRARSRAPCGDAGEATGGRGRDGARGAARTGSASHSRRIAGAQQRYQQAAGVTRPPARGRESRSAPRQRRRRSADRLRDAKSSHGKNDRAGDRRAAAPPRGAPPRSSTAKERQCFNPSAVSPSRPLAAIQHDAATESKREKKQIKSKMMEKLVAQFLPQPWS